MAQQTKQLLKSLGIAYVIVALGLVYFAIYPTLPQGETWMFGITLFWILTLAAIMATYSVAVVFFGGEDEHAHA